MSKNPHHTPEKVFHERVVRKAKELLKTEPLVITTTVCCCNKECNKFLFIYVSSLYPKLNIKFPYCGKKIDRRILSNNFINSNLYELAKSYVLVDLEILKAQNSMMSESATSSTDSSEIILSDEHISNMTQLLDDVDPINKVIVVDKEKAKTLGLDRALILPNGDMVVADSEALASATK